MSEDTKDTGAFLRECAMCGEQLHDALFIVHDEEDFNSQFPGAWKAVCCSQACAVAWREIDEIEGLPMHVQSQHVDAPRPHCKECGKVCPFDHDVPAGELVCDVCAGADPSDVDW